MSDTGGGSPTPTDVHHKPRRKPRHERHHDPGPSGGGSIAPDHDGHHHHHGHHAHHGRTAVEGMHVHLAHLPGLTPKHILHHREKMHFQCPPMDPFTITYAYDSRTYETVYDGTFSVNAAAQLDIVQFKTLFTDERWGFELFWHYDVSFGRDLLKRLAKSGAPVMLTCVHHHGDTAEYHGPVTLTTYTHTESEPFAYYADVTFQEYRDPTVTSIIHTRHGGRHWPKHIKLTAKDTLYSLAKHYYGKASAARHIAIANHIHNTDFHRPIVKLGGRWKVGATITLPAPPPNKPKKHGTHRTKD